MQVCSVCHLHATMRHSSVLTSLNEGSCVVEQAEWLVIAHTSSAETPLWIGSLASGGETEKDCTALEDPSGSSGSSLCSLGSRAESCIVANHMCIGAVRRHWRVKQCAMPDTSFRASSLPQAAAVHPILAASIKMSGIRTCENAWWVAVLRKGSTRCSTLP